MPALPEDLRQLLGQLGERLGEFYGERYAGLILFGSYARGDWTEHSDVDLLLLLKGEVSSSREIMRAEDVVYPSAFIRWCAKHSVFVKLATA